MDARKVVTLVLEDGTVVKRLAKVVAPDRRRPDFVNKVATGMVRPPRCRRCGQTGHRLGSCCS